MLHLCSFEFDSTYTHVVRAAYNLPNKSNNLDQKIKSIPWLNEDDKRIEQRLKIGCVVV